VEVHLGWRAWALSHRHPSIEVEVTSCLRRVTDVVV